MGNGSSRQDWGGTALPLLLLEHPSPKLATPLSDDLLAVIQEQVLPQLALAHGARDGAPGDAADERTPPTDNEVALLATLAVEQGLVGALGLVASLLRQGLSIESVLLLLVAPAAQLLSEQWLTEVRTFTEVLAGLDVLKQVAEALKVS